VQKATVLRTDGGKTVRLTEAKRAEALKAADKFKVKRTERLDAKPKQSKKKPLPAGQRPAQKPNQPKSTTPDHVRTKYLKDHKYRETALTEGRGVWNPQTKTLDALPKRLTNAAAPPQSGSNKQPAGAAAQQPAAGTAQSSTPPRKTKPLSYKDFDIAPGHHSGTLRYFRLQRKALIT